MAIDPELRAVSQVVRDYGLSPDPRIAACDAIFTERLRVQPKVLKLSYWARHFEWRTVFRYPEMAGHILDFGCGAGHADVHIAQRGRLVHGVDVSPLAIRLASRLLAAQSDEIRGRLSFECADVTVPREGGRRYDAVWSADVFEHIAEPARILAGLRQWVIPGAPVLIAVPLAFAYDDPGHIHHWPDAEAFRVHFSGLLNVVRVDTDEEDGRLRLLGTL